MISCLRLFLSILLLAPVISGTVLAQNSRTEDRELNLPITYLDLQSICSDYVNRDPHSIRNYTDRLSKFCTSNELTFDEVPTEEELNQTAVGGIVRRQDEELGLQEASAAVLGINQAALLFGLTDFLLKRAETEVRDWVLQDFASDLCDKKPGGYENVRIHILLDHTCTVFAPGGEAVPLLLGNGAMLRSVLQEDLRGLLETLTEETLRISKNEGKRQDPSAAAHVLATAVREIIDGTSPAVALRQMSDPRGKAFLDSPFGAKMLNGTFTTDRPLSQGLFLATQALTAMPLQSETALEMPENRNQIRYLIKVVAINLKGEGGKYDGENRILVDGVLQKLASFENLYQTLKPAVEKFKQASTTFESAVRKDTSSEIRLQTFGAFTYQAIALVQELSKFSASGLPPEVTRMLDAVKNASRDIATGNYAAFSVNVVVVAQELGVEMPNALTRMIFLGGQLAMVQDAESAEQAIEAFAAPPGSWRRKREGNWYWTINAYVGGVIGGEHVSATGDIGVRAKGDWSPVTGLHIPVGLEVGVPEACVPIPRVTHLCSGSLGIFAQVIDLGVLVSYRLDESDTVDQMPEVGVRQVFSPGIYGTFGFGNSPISLLAGFSYLPALRALSTDENVELNAWRYSLSVVFDIPLLF